MTASISRGKEDGGQKIDDRGRISGVRDGWMGGIKKTVSRRGAGDAKKELILLGWSRQWLGVMHRMGGVGLGDVHKNIKKSRAQVRFSGATGSR